MLREGNQLEQRGGLIQEGKQNRTGGKYTVTWQWASSGFSRTNYQNFWGGGERSCDFSNGRSPRSRTDCKNRSEITTAQMGGGVTAIGQIWCRIRISDDTGPTVQDLTAHWWHLGWTVIAATFNIWDPFGIRVRICIVIGLLNLLYERKSTRTVWWRLGDGSDRRWLNYGGGAGVL